MSIPTSETLTRIKNAAQMLVEGASWAGIAKLYGYANADSAHSMLAQGYPEIWRKEYEDARTKYMAEVEAEAALTQRALLRPFRQYVNPNGEQAIQAVPVQVSQSAAHSLLSHATKDRAQKLEVSGPGGGVIRFEFADIDDDDGDNTNGEPDTDEQDDSPAEPASGAT